MADPITDIALFGFCSNMDIERTLQLFDLYINCDDIDKDSFLKRIQIDNNYDDMKSLLIAYMAIDAIACSIWNLIRITITNKYSFNYGELCLNTFDACYEYLLKNGSIK
jgi:hypothetical protein